MSRSHTAVKTCAGQGRRSFLTRTGAALLGLAAASQIPTDVTSAQKYVSDPFTLGVASGDPLPDGFVIWTRLAPDPLNAGGMPRRKYPVEWQVATDEGMQNVVRRGAVLAAPEMAHSVHVELAGLSPARWYWYRFRAGDALSPVGRARTAPAFGSQVDKLSFAFASCQNWQNGYYTAYRHMADENLDLVVHLGDYIYEGGVAANSVRPHNGPEIYSLDDYRNRYALYKTDTHLQAAHAACPWLVTWDDHEVDNNYAAEISQDNDDPQIFLARRALAYQAYYEHQPLRLSSLPAGPDMPLYRRVTFGDIAEFNMLDGRQYRSDQPGSCAEAQKTPRGYCPRAEDPNQTMLGGGQLNWLFAGLDRSPARWNVLANQTRFAQHDGSADPNRREFGEGDNWNGYVVERDRIIDFMARRPTLNPVVITGDIHTNWAYDLKADFDDATSAAVGTEFIGTSISSGGDRVISTALGGTADNPHLRFRDNHHGYVRCVLTPQQWRADFRVIPTVRSADVGAVSTLASFVVSDKRPGAEVI